MAIKVGGTTVIDDSRNVDNIGTIKGLTYPSADGTAGQFLKTDGAGNLAFQTVQTDPTLATLTKSFSSGESASLSLSTAISTAPVVSVIKEVPQTGVSSKGTWDVAADGANYTRHDTAYDTTLTPTSEGWDISTATFSQSFSVAAQETDVLGAFFKPDGTKMYVIGRGLDNVNEYNLSTAWDVSTASFVHAFSVAAQETNPTAIFFKPDGTKMYVIGTIGDDVNEYNLSTAWNVSTASYLQTTGGLQDATPQGLFFKPDGTKMYIVGNGATNVYEYTLSTAWNVSTQSLLQTFSVGTQDTAPTGLFFKPDGTKMYVSGAAGTDVNEYNLTTAWDISSASFLQNFGVAGQDSSITDLSFKTDGTKMFIVGNTGNAIYEYDLDAVPILALGAGSFASGDVGKTIEGNGGKAVLTAADGSYSEVTAFTDSSTIASGDWGMFGTVVNTTDGLELSNVVLNYQVQNASPNGSVSISSGNPFPHGLFFKPDGTRLYVVGLSTDDVVEWNLTSAWDVTTASQGNSFYVGGQETVPLEVFFKPDGTKMYISGETGDGIDEYSLSTPWDVTSASHTAFTATSVSDNNLFGLAFKTDGTKMYVVDEGTDDIHEYDLSTAWDTTTITFVQTFDLAANGGIPANPGGIEFTPDGLTLFVVGHDYQSVYKYTLSTAWDVSTASSNGAVVDLTAYHSSMRSIRFSSDGLTMYILDYGSDLVSQYDVGAIYAPTSTYQVSVTNAGGQIDSEFWTDINTMTADQDVGDGAVYYAVSTDNRTTWSVIKDSDGVRPIVRNNAGTWEYNTAVENPDAWDISQASFNQLFSVVSQDALPRDVFFKPDGAKMYVIGTDNDLIYEYDLSSSWNVSTSVFNQSFNIVSEGGAPSSLFFKPDGTKMYFTDQSGREVNEYNLSTAWDISTATFNQLFSISAQEGGASGLFFKPDGSKMFVSGSGAESVHEYSLSTPWSISSGSFTHSFSVSSQDTTPTGLFFKPDGTKMYVTGDTGDDVNEYNLSTAWDVSTSSYLQNFSVASQETALQDVSFKPDGTKMYIVGGTGGVAEVNEYDIGTNVFTTSSTWTAATSNTEIDALQQALTDLSFNRMDKTQLDAVTDPNHYTLGDSLDLMIGLYQGTASANVPSSDGVTINYDAEVLNQGAVMGTDYDIDIPDSSTVRVTSNATQNLKIRVV